MGDLIHARKGNPLIFSYHENEIQGENRWQMLYWMFLNLSSRILRF